MPHKNKDARRQYHKGYDSRRKRLGGAALAAERTKWAKANPERIYRIGLKSRLKTKYGITLEKFEEMHNNQGGRCAICNQPGKALNGHVLVVDHSHETGKVRGLLCGPCNTLLGCAKDRMEVLYCAIEYLKRNQGD